MIPPVFPVPDPQMANAGEYWLCREPIKGWQEVRYVIEDCPAPYTLGACGNAPASVHVSGHGTTAKVWALMNPEAFVRLATAEEVQAWIAEFGVPEQIAEERQKAGLPPLSPPATADAQEAEPLQLLRDLVKGLQETTWSSWQHTDKFSPAQEAAEAYLDALTKAGQ